MALWLCVEVYTDLLLLLTVWFVAVLFRAVPVKNRTPLVDGTWMLTKHPPDVSIPETTSESGFLGVALDQTPRISDLHISPHYPD